MDRTEYLLKVVECADMSLTQRCQALNDLGKIMTSEPEASVAVATALKAELWPIRRCAAELIGEYVMTDCLPSVRDALKAERISLVVGALIETLVKLGDLESIATFALYSNCEQALIAIDQLCYFGERSLSVLTKLIQHADERKRVQAATVLGCINHPLSIRLLSAAFTDTSSSVAVAAVNSLVRLQAFEALEALSYSYPEQMSQVA